MGKWHGEGIPPTRKKLHRWRAAIREQQMADEKAQRSVLSSIEAEGHRLGVDFMLTERGELL